ncbi:MAG: cyclase family protein [Steroidobacteraceae bacterium]
MHRSFDTGIVLKTPKKSWKVVTVADRERTGKVETDDIVIINTDWRKKYSASQESFGDAPGLSPKTANWLVKRSVSISQNLRHIALTF